MVFEREVINVPEGNEAYIACNKTGVGKDTREPLERAPINPNLVDGDNLGEKGTLE